ncbi:MAG: carbohydrate-binding protein [Elusimicrobia bacterium]|nr:carbohydrate-binding protein [Elusimicrobiota bacterium]
MFRKKLVKIFSIFVVCIFVSISILSGVTDTTPPGKIMYFVTAFPTSKTVTLVWRATGDDGNSGKATKYDIRYSPAPITTETSWNSATKVKFDMIPNSAGSAESLMVFGLSPSTKYYFAIRAGDEVTNWSPLSKSPSATTPALTDTTPPAKITDLAITNIAAKSVTLTWTSPGDDGNTGLASRYIPYDIRYSLSPITDANWDSATKAEGAPTAQETFRQETFTVPELSPSTKYYFAIKTPDEVPNWSKVSNNPTGTTKIVGVSVPYKGVPFQVPGKIELEDYDKGGAETSYYDTSTGNAGNAYRTTEDVDVETCSDANGGYSVGWAMTGEWLKYTINVKTAGTYTIEVRVACGGPGGTFHIEFDDINKTGSMTVPDTGGWQTWQTIKKTGVRLSAGKHIMKLTMDTIGAIATGNFNYINIINEGQLKPGITVTVPNGGENWIANSQQIIAWSSQGIVGNVNIDLSTDGGTNWIKLVSNIPNDGSETITIPNKASNTCKIRVRDINGIPGDSSDTNFKISFIQPNDKLFFHEGAVFPNPNLAPISTPYIIAWFAGDGEQPHETTNVHGYLWASKAWHDEMIAKGKLPIPYSYAERDNDQSPSPWKLNNEESMYENYLKAAQEGYYGIEIDEYAAWDYDSRAQESINALRRVKKQYPNFFITAAFYGDGIDETISNGADVLSLYEPEIYIYRGIMDYRTYIKKWTDWVKYYGLEGKTNAIFSGQNDFVGLPEDVDLWIKYLRAESPQMAGLGIRIFKLYSLNTEERAKFDKVMDDNFFKLSPSVSITAPVKNTSVNGTVKIAVSSAKNPETDRLVVSYRYFIDTKLVKISSSPEYLWNTAGYSKGKHIITVHAVADDYLAGVSQLNLTVK